MEMLIPPGITIKKDGKVVAKSVIDSMEDGLVTGISIIDRAGNDIDYIITTDESKMPGGKYANKNVGFYNKQTLSQDSRRLIFTPNKYSHPDVAFPMQFIDLLQDPRYDFIRQTFEEHLLNVSNKYSDEIIKMAKDPNFMRHQINYLYRLEGNHPAAIERSMDITDKGVHHPTRISSFIQSIYNKWLKKGSFQGRTKRNKDGLGGSIFKLQPDLTNEITDFNNVIISAGNRAIFNNVMYRYMKDNNISQKQFNNDNKTLGDKIRTLNEFLKDNEINMLSYRNPVDSAYSVSLKRIQSLADPIYGDAIFGHPDTVYGQWRGDHDGDTVLGEILPDDITKKLKTINFHKSEVFDDTPAVLDWFRKDSLNLKFSNEMDRIKAISEIARTKGSTGLVTNLRTVRGSLILKDFEIKSKTGKIYKPLKPTDTVIMEYAPLDPDLTQEDLKGTPATIVEKNGIKYLQTTSEHELTILLNATTDNPKEALLGQWGFNSTEFLMQRMWRDQDGNPPSTKTNKDGTLTKESKEDLALLKTVNQIFKRNNTRKGRTKNGNRHTFNSLMKNLKVLNKFLSMDLEGKTQVIKARIDLVRANKWNKMFPSEFEYIKMNDELTSVEKLLVNPIQRLEQEFGDLVINPFLSNPTKLWNTHYHAINGDLIPTKGNLTTYFNKNFNLSIEEDQIASDFVHTLQFPQQAIDIMIKKKSGKSDMTPGMQGLDHNEDLINLTEKGLRWLDKATKDAGLTAESVDNIKAGITMYFLRGNKDKKEVNIHPDVVWFNKDVYKKYMELWEDNFTMQEISEDQNMYPKEQYNPVGNLIQTKERGC